MLQLLAGILGGWAFALMLPSGDPRPHADDILNILLQRDQPWVRAAWPLPWAWRLALQLGLSIAVWAVPTACHECPLCQVSQYSAYLWDITTLIPGIPVLAIMVRYNLLSGKVQQPASHLG